MESAQKEIKSIQMKPEIRPYRSVEQKLDIIKRVNDGESLSEVCAKEKIREMTVLRWIEEKRKLQNLFKAKLQNRLKILLACNSQKTSVHMRNQQVQDALYSWYTACMKNGVQMCNEQIADKAKEFNKSFGGKSDFNPTALFIADWKNKYKIELNLLDHPQRKDESVMEHFSKRLLEIIENDALTREQVFICGELNIDYKNLPTRESIIQQFKEKDFCKNNFKKKSEIDSEQLSIMFCSNTTGTLRLPLMVTGNSTITSDEELPVYYKYRDKELIEEQAFEEWQREKGIPRVRIFLKRKNLSPMALMIVSHFDTSGTINVFNEKTVYLPPNASGLTESFNQKVLRELKLRFWLKVFSYVVESRECGFDVTNVTLEGALHLLDEAWNETSVEAYSHFQSYLQGNKNMKIMAGEENNLLLKLLSLVKRFQGEESNECQVKKIQTIEIDGKESKMREEVKEVYEMYLDSEESDTNFEKKANFEEVKSTIEVEVVDLELEEEEEINITNQDPVNKMTEANETPKVFRAEIDKSKTDINSVEVSNTTLEECITSLKTAIKFFKSRNKYEKYSDDIKLLKSLVNKAYDLDTGKPTNIDTLLQDLKN